MEIRIKRIHDSVDPDDGMRVLVDRVWPRGVRKADAALDAWLRELAPSTDLRRWFGHDADRWVTFRDRYRGELAQHTEVLDELLARAGNGPLTLLFAARDREHNNAVVLRDVLRERLAAAQNNPGS